MSQPRENLWTDGRKDRLYDGQTTLFHRTLPATPGGPTRETIKKPQIKHCLTNLNNARAICWK